MCLSWVPFDFTGIYVNKINSTRFVFFHSLSWPDCIFWSKCCNIFCPSASRSLQIMQAFVAKAVRGKFRSCLYNPWTCKHISCLNKSLKFQSYLSKAMRTVIDWFWYLMPSLNSKKKPGHIHVNNLSVSIKCNLCRQAAAWATVLPLSDSGKELSVSTCCYSSETQRLNGITFYM